MITTVTRQPLLLRGGTLIDGVWPEASHADVRVDGGGVITEIGPRLRPRERERVIDVDGLTVAPGFIDMHSHSDLYTMLRHDGGAPVGDAPKLLQGCTAQIFGQDGISVAPVAEHDVEPFASFVAGLDGSLNPATWTWRNFAEYLEALRRHSSTRTRALVGHSTIRRFVMGMEARPPTDAELDAMCALLDASLSAGALGLSTGLVYVPAAYAEADELLALCRVVARHRGRFFVHVRSESDRVVEATEEVLDIARRSRVHLHYSHIKTAGRQNWPLAATILEMIETYRTAGVAISADVHPYTAGSTTATVLLPPWLLEGGLDAAIHRLADQSTRARVRQQILEDSASWDNWFAFSGGWDGLRVADAKSPGVAGRSFSDVIGAAGVADDRSVDAFDVVFDLLVGEALKMSIISYNNVEDNVALFLSQPFTSVGSDALVNPDGVPHPRLYGTFPRVLGHFVRERQVLELGDAVVAMTSRAARAAGVTDIGRISRGAPGDIVIFDPATVADRATYEQPRLSPVGIRHVFVGGVQVVADGELAGSVPPAAAMATGGVTHAENPTSKR